MEKMAREVKVGDTVTDILGRRRVVIDVRDDDSCLCMDKDGDVYRIAGAFLFYLYSDGDEDIGRCYEELRKKVASVASLHTAEELRGRGELS